MNKAFDKMLQKQIPERQHPDNIRVATWNIRDFGKKARSDRAIGAIASVIRNFDLISITELKDNLEDLYRVLNLIPENYSFIFSDYTNDRGGNKERMCFLYKNGVINFTGLAAEANPNRKKVDGEYIASQSWWRTPYMASFYAPEIDVDFVMLVMHARWAKKKILRTRALNNIGKWVHDRKDDKFVMDKDFILSGDFNVETPDQEQALLRSGLVIPDAIKNPGGTNIIRTKNYDQLLVPEHFNVVTGGVVDFYQGDHKKFFPKIKTKHAYTFEMSDHLPLYVEIAAKETIVPVEAVVQAA